MKILSCASYGHTWIFLDDPEMTMTCFLASKKLFIQNLFLTDCIPDILGLHGSKRNSDETETL
jgi:hypothetical protein